MGVPTKEDTTPVVSVKGSLNKSDLKSWGKNALIFAGPALLVLLASIAKAIPIDASYGIIALYVVNLATDLLRKFIAGS